VQSWRITLNASLLKSLWQEFNRYKAWLDEQSVGSHTQRAYVSRLNQFFVFLATEDNAYEEVLSSKRVRNRAVEDYKDYLKHHLKYNPSTINTTLSTIDHFYGFIGLGEPDIEREPLKKGTPVALTQEEERSLLWTVERSLSLRDLALVLVFLRAGLRVGECAALNLEDVDASGERVTVNIRSEKKNRARLIALDAETGEAIKSWITRRSLKFPNNSDQALFLSRLGRRITTAGIDLTIRKYGRSIGIEISAEVLRHTCLTRMLSTGKDLSLVKRLSGHKRLETTKRYRPAAISICEDFSPAKQEDVLSEGGLQIITFETFEPMPS
jgi:site-specific recombinase XerD